MWPQVAPNGLFHGFHADTALVIGLQSIGGLLTGVVIKYAGNILKNFANALAILTTSFLAMALFAYHPTGLFWLGVIIVCLATSMYGWTPQGNCSVAAAIKAAHRLLGPRQQNARLYAGGATRSDASAIDPEL